MTLQRRAGLTPVPLRRKEWWNWRPPTDPRVPLRAARLPGVAGNGKSAAARRSETGFSPAVKLLVRTRAGNGDPDSAMCEADGIWLGRHGGDVQHIVARGMGGCKLAVIGSPANAALLCRRCHDLCEARDPHMEAAGFWARQGTDPRTLPMMLASEHGSGITVWRSADGHYLLEAPEVAA